MCACPITIICCVSLLEQMFIKLVNIIHSSFHCVIKTNWCTHLHLTLRLIQSYLNKYFVTHAHIDIPKFFTHKNFRLIMQNKNVIRARSYRMAFNLLLLFHVLLMKLKPITSLTSHCSFAIYVPLSSTSRIVVGS